MRDRRETGAKNRKRESRDIEAKWKTKRRKQGRKTRKNRKGSSC